MHHKARKIGRDSRVFFALCSSLLRSVRPVVGVSTLEGEFLLLSGRVR